MFIKCWGVVLLRQCIGGVGTQVSLFFKRERREKVLFPDKGYVIQGQYLMFIKWGGVVFLR